MQRLQYLATVITLVGDQLFHSQQMNLPRYRLRFRQRFMHRGGIAFIGRLQRDRQQRATRKIDGVLGFVGQMRASVFHFL